MPNTGAGLPKPGSSDDATDRTLARANRFLRTFGLLPLTAPAGVPSLVELVVGGRIRGSWWGHPAGGLIFATGQRLDEGASSSLSLKLVDNRVTWVHRRLWLTVLSIGTAREPWQLRGLDRGPRDLLAEVDRLGSVTGDQLAADLPAGGYRELRDQARSLEGRLLAVVGSEHTSSGAHALTLRSWRHWAAEHRLRAGSLSGSEARLRIEAVGARLAPSVPLRWPWTAPARVRSRRGSVRGSP